MRVCVLNISGAQCATPEPLIRCSPSFFFFSPLFLFLQGNKGAYINFNGTDMKPKCVSFTHVPHPTNIPPMAYASNMFR